MDAITERKRQVDAAAGVRLSKLEKVMNTLQTAPPGTEEACPGLIAAIGRVGANYGEMILQQHTRELAELAQVKAKFDEETLSRLDVEIASARREADALCLGFQPGDLAWMLARAEARLINVQNAREMLKPSTPQ